MNRRAYLVCLLMLLACGTAKAQDQIYTTYAQGSITQMVKDQRAVDARNAAHIGQDYQPFNLAVQNGKHITTASSAGKVSLFFFWTDYEIVKLQGIYKDCVKNRDFQMVFITYDTVGLKLQMNKNKMQLPYTFISPMTYTMEQMSLDNGYPSFVILDKQTKVALSGTVWRFGNDEAWLPEVKEVISKILK